jgi:hypothetical protein
MRADGCDGLIVSRSRPIIINAKVWQKYWGLIGKTKIDHIAKLKTIYDIDVKKTEDGIADSILLGGYFLKQKWGVIECQTTESLDYF